MAKQLIKAKTSTATPENMAAAEKANTAKIEVKAEGTKQEQTLKSVSTVDPITAEAFRFGKRLDEATISHLSSGVMHMEKADSSFIPLTLDVRRIYTKDEIAGMPWPGSDAESVKGTNNKADRYKVKIIVDGKPREQAMRWVEQVWRATPHGKDVTEKLEAAQLKIKDKIGNKTVNITDEKTYKKQKTNAVKLLAFAIATAKQQIEIESAPLLIWTWVKDTAGKPIESTVPLVIGGKNDPMNETTGPISRTQFLSYSVQEALTNGGTFEALVKTAARERTESERTGEPTFTIKKVEDMETVFSLFATFMGEATTQQAMEREAALIKALQANRDFRHSFGRFMMAADPAWTVIAKQFAREELEELRKTQTKMENEASQKYQERLMEQAS